MTRAYTVQLYDDDRFPADSLAAFLWEGSRGRGGVSLILTAEHARAVNRSLRRLGVDPVRLARRRRLLLLDADEALELFMTRGRPDPRRFEQEICDRISAVIPPRGRGYAVGEMVARLAAAGNLGGALALESLWSSYVAASPLTLRCLYPISLLARPGFARTFHRVMSAHDNVVPVLDNARESTAAPDSVDTDRWIARLQQQTQALKEEVKRRKAAELAAAASRRQLRSLGRHLVAVGEEERTRMSRRIHDELGQSLAALRMDLDRLRRRLRAEDEDPQERLVEMMAVVEHLTTRVQRIAIDLRPAMLDDLGLAAAVDWLARDFQGRTGIVCNARVPSHAFPLDRDRATAVYRVLQEALSNVERHARATSVEVVLTQSTVGVDLVVRDDGVGITGRQARSAASLGLTGMRERAQSMGGRLGVTGSSGRGTTVRLHLSRRAKALS